MTGRKIKLALWSRGFTFRGIARELSVSEPHVCQVAHGRTRSARVRARIAELLGFDPFPPEVQRKGRGRARPGRVSP